MNAEQKVGLRRGESTVSCPPVAIGCDRARYLSITPIDDRIGYHFDGVLIEQEQLGFCCGTDSSQEGRKAYTASSPSNPIMPSAIVIK